MNYIYAKNIRINTCSDQIRQTMNWDGEWWKFGEKLNMSQSLGAEIIFDSRFAGNKANSINQIGKISTTTSKTINYKLFFANWFPCI